MNTRLIFSWWYLPKGSPQPFCECLNAEDRSIYPLSNLLMDDGGLALENTLTWISAGIGMVDSVKKGELTTAYWAREEWEATIGPSLVRVSSQLDESEAYVQVVAVNDFRRVLCEWSSFIRTEPGAQVRQVIELDGGVHS